MKERIQELMNEGNLEEAEALIQSQLKERPKSYSMLCYLREIYDRQNERDKSMEVQKKIAKLMKTRRYLPGSMSVENFFEALNHEHIRYVVLRWYDHLPDIGKGEDIDILVHDEDLIKLSKYISPKKENNSSIPCDVYSVSGTIGSDYRGLPYYPKVCAENILSERVLWKDKYFVPNLRHYLLSMAYHVVYHKAEKSGLPLRIRKENKRENNNNKYVKALQPLFSELGLDIELTWTDLQKFLDQNGWIPELLLLKGLAEKSDWLENLYYLRVHDMKNTGELMVFILREWAHENNLTNWIVKWLETHKLRIIDLYELDEMDKEKAACSIRGGNWGPDRWREYGGSGKPAVLIIAYDFHPIPLDKQYEQNYPYVTNGRFLLKMELREELNKEQPSNKKRSIIHSSDNTLEAIEFMKVVYPEKIPEILNKISLEKENRGMN